MADARGRLPLKELELLVLLTLYNGPMHGYALLTGVAQQSAGFTTPGPASLYRTIGALFQEGLLQEIGSAEDDDPRRRYYQATAAGRSVVRAELARLEGLIARARSAGVRFEAGS